MSVQPFWDASIHQLRIVSTLLRNQWLQLLCRLTVCVTCWWAGVDNAHYSGKCLSQKNAYKSRRIPPVKCTLCWAAILRRPFLYSSDIPLLVWFIWKSIKCCACSFTKEVACGWLMVSCNKLSQNRFSSSLVGPFNILFIIHTANGVG